MPRYYCDYCDTYLTHDSPSVRKQHNAGYKHKANVRSYYQQFEEQQTQSLIDQRIKEHLGQAAAFQQQVGATFNQHLMSLQANPQRPRLPILPPQMLPIGAPQGLMAPPMVPGLRPPILPRPMAGAPGYPALQSMAPPGSISMSMQMGNLPGPPNMNPPATAPGANGPPTMYQSDPSMNLGQAGAGAPPPHEYSYAQPAETSH